MCIEFFDTQKEILSSIICRKDNFSDKISFYIPHQVDSMKPKIDKN